MELIGRGVHHHVLDAISVFLVLVAAAFAWCGSAARSQFWFDARETFNETRPRRVGARGRGESRELGCSHRIWFGLFAKEGLI